MKKNKSLRPRISLRQKIILVLFGLSLFFVLLEVGLRLGGFISLSLQEYRNRQTIRHKGTYRILCLGESTTLSGGNNSYPSQLERILNQRSKGIKFSVINKGIPATDTTTIVLQLEENLNRYKPEMVITMMGVNDWGEFMPRVAITKSRTKRLLTSLRIYKLSKLIWLHVVHKACAVTQSQRQEEKGAILCKDNSRKQDQTKTDYLGLGRSYMKQQKYNQAAEMFRKGFELEPGNEWLCLGLARTYQYQLNISEAEAMFRKAVQLNRKNDRALFELGGFYCSLGRYLEAEEIYREAIALNPANELACVDLAGIYMIQNKYTEAEALLKKLIEQVPGSSRGYAGLIELYDARVNNEAARRYQNEFEKLQQANYKIVTQKNYLKLKEILDKRRIKLICVQYPVCSVRPLQELFKGQKNVVFVDNEGIFKNALRQGSFGEYFSDMFAGDFGHCTRKGNQLLAENIAKIILKEVFRQ